MLFSQIVNNSKNDNGNNSSYTATNNETVKNNTVSSNDSNNKSTNGKDTSKEEKKTTENRVSENKGITANNSSTSKSENKNSQNNNNSTSEKEIKDSKPNVSSQTELSVYKAVWQYPDGTYPDQEFIVKSITNSKVEFDYIIDGITTFENVSASISGNIATFDIKNEGDWNIKGDITFDDNKVILNIKESSSDNIPTGSTTFKVKSSKSAFQS